MANKYLLELLMQGKPGLQKWKVTHPNEPLDLSNAEISDLKTVIHLSLKGADLTKSTLARSNFQGTDFSGANFSGADCRTSLFRDTVMSGANFSGANLEGVDFRNAKLDGCNFSGANLTKANLSKVDLSKAILTKADLSYAVVVRSRIENALLTDIILKGTKLDSVNMNGSEMSGVNFRNAKLNDVSFVGANLSYATLENANLENVYLVGANLIRANLKNANLRNAVFGVNFEEAGIEKNADHHSDFMGADLSCANLTLANLSEANFTFCKLNEANLSHSICYKTNFRMADMTGCYLIAANLIEANVEDAILKNCSIYGISVWNLKGKPTEQVGLVITNYDEPEITIDNLQVAQFIYLILNNEKIRDVIGTVAQKGVLILGRFTPKRKKILDAIRDKLREHDFVPMMFDFEKVSSRDFTETIRILAGMSRFIIADITSPKSSPLELQATVPDYKIPFVTIIQQGELPFSMFRDLRKKHDWVLDPIEYDSETDLMTYFKTGIIDEAMKKEIELNNKETEDKTVLRNMKEFK